MNPMLVTGASGFFGGVLKRRLLAEGHTVVNLDLLPDPDGAQPDLTSLQGDIRDTALLDRLFREHRFAGVVHCAAKLAHDTVSDDDLWSSNVDGTRNIAQACLDHGVPVLVNISTNCLWAHNVGHAIAEDEPPAPVELYGRSKLEAEHALEPFGTQFPVITIRCPTIIDEGRLGLLAILFEFIEDGKRVWVVGDGGNRYQFIYAQDLATACLQALNHRQTELFHIGADDVVSLREVYEAVIRDSLNAAGQTSTRKRRARVAQLPKAPTLAAMKLAHKLKISPLGPYHYRMIAEDFLFDTTRIRERLGWRPTLSNADMMVRAFRYYSSRRADIHARADTASAHSKAAPMGIIRLLKWLS
ncbi:MAG TPA: NAD(P)-dependent oxidoreductase [Acidobacteriaceae bacterium]|nr:NAD(P)-dependent oxidoreductase [Acidobacteriaceae bacterium]